MSKKRTLEQAYFHINNGGLSFSIVEKIDVRKSIATPPQEYLSADLCEHVNEVPGRCPCHHDCFCRQPGYACYVGIIPRTPPKKEPEVLTNRRWRFRVTTNHFGAETRYEFPLVPVMIRWIVEALNRVLTRMETPTGQPTDGFEFAFRNEECWVKTRDGKDVAGPSETPSRSTGGRVESENP